MNNLHIASHIVDIVAHLRSSGFETYVVGGAVRDAVLERSPKDYDLSSAATPAQIRAVFGRRRAMIIGKRFQIVHLRHQGEIIEISTFRCRPSPHLQNLRANSPENLIVADNEFGTAEEDAWRRDFTVNAIFYDPTSKLIVDHTGMGMADLRGGVVRIIGDPALRFEEDPVRLLRALKLVGQYDFQMEPQTAAALGEMLPLIHHASKSRLSLELEKILKNPYGDAILAAFEKHGFLSHFMPSLHKRWRSAAGRAALDLLRLRNLRVRHGAYRDSLSLALATLAMPFASNGDGSDAAAVHAHWPPSPDEYYRIEALIGEICDGFSFPRRLVAAAANNLLLHSILERSEPDERLIHLPGYGHAREMMILRGQLENGGHDVETPWPAPGAAAKMGEKPWRPKKRRRRGGHRGPRREA